MAEQTQKHRHEEQAKAEAAARVFKARKMLVVPEAWKPTVESKHTAPAPFSLTTDARHEVASSAFEAKRQEEERQAAKDREFKATKPTVLSVPPFEPHKSTKPLTSLSAAKFQRTENRFERRKEFEAQLAARRAQKEAEVAVTVFPGTVGGLTANVNRWRGQIGLPPASEADIQAQIQARAQAKKDRDFATADRIRQELAAQGVVLKDSPTGTTWERG
jgi:cysteinyl-tRNA synthetase